MMTPQKALELAAAIENEPKMLVDGPTLKAALAAFAKSEVAYAIQNEQGYFVGIWADKEIAKFVASKQPPANCDKILEVLIIPAE